MNSRTGGRLTLAISLCLLLVGAQRWKERVMAPETDPLPPGFGPNFYPPPSLLRPEAFPSRRDSSRTSPRRTAAPVRVTGPAVFTMETVKLRRWGPVYGQNRWSDNDLTLQSIIRVRNVVVHDDTSHAPFNGVPGPGYNVLEWGGKVVEPRSNVVEPDDSIFEPGEPNRSPNPLKRSEEIAPPRRAGQTLTSGWELRGADGVTFPPPYGNLITPFNQFSRDGTLYLTKEMRVPGAAYSMATSFDLDRVPASHGVLTLGTTFSMPDGSAVPLEFEVRPAWFTRAARTLKLQSTQWIAPENGDDGSVLVTLHSSGAPLVLKDEFDGSRISWQVALDPLQNRAREIITERKLLHNWSPRLESADGKFNSHAAKDAQVWASYRKFTSAPASRGEKVPIQEYLADFWPKIWAQAPVQNGKSITVRYRLYGLKGSPQAQLFKTEVGVPGEGFLPVEVPLPR